MDAQMSDIDFFAMFLLGIFGTGHCLGMCGPLIFALPGRSGRFAPHLWYHAGRLLTYTAVGGALGGLGAGLAQLVARTGEDHLTRLVAVQVGFSILAAGFLFGFGLGRLGLLPEPSWLSEVSPQKIPGLRKLLKQNAADTVGGAYFALGLMLGLLPCGLSFAAFSRALAAGGILNGAALVLAFGLGTLPGLLLLGTGVSGIVRRYRKPADLLSGLLMILMAIALAADALQALI
jgi:sulfite exporter TauE/SafE